MGYSVRYPSFVKPTPEDGKVLAFARNICLGQLPAKVVVLLECIAPIKVEVPREAEMEAELVHLATGQPRLSKDTPRPERVSSPRESLDPLSLVHLLMVSLFLLFSNV